MTKEQKLHVAAIISAETAGWNGWYLDESARMEMCEKAAKKICRYIRRVSTKESGQTVTKLQPCGSKASPKPRYPDIECKHCGYVQSSRWVMCRHCHREVK